MMCTVYLETETRDVHSVLYLKTKTRYMHTGYLETETRDVLRFIEPGMCTVIQRQRPGMCPVYLVAGTRDMYRFFRDRDLGCVRFI